MLLSLILTCMVICYSMPIFLIYSNFNENLSISSVICTTNNNDIKFYMFMMGIFTILYEIKRNNIFSLCYIILLLIGIWGVLNYDESNNLHIIFSLIVFLSILAFMHNFNSISHITNLLYYIQIVISLLLLVFYNFNIFYLEVLALLNFTIFYFYLHFKKNAGQHLVKNQLF